MLSTPPLTETGRKAIKAAISANSPPQGCEVAGLAADGYTRLPASRGTLWVSVVKT
jgi:hypothetical protein